MLRERFGRLVADQRRRVGFTQPDLAERAGLSLDTIKKLETGATGPSIETIEQLADALGVDPSALFGWEATAATRSELSALYARLGQLSDEEIRWLTPIIEAVLQPRRFDGSDT